MYDKGDRVLTPQPYLGVGSTYWREKSHRMQVGIQKEATSIRKKKWERFKARLVAKEFSQQEEDRLWWVVRHIFIRLVLALVATWDFHLEQMDVKTTFLLQMQVPSGCQSKYWPDRSMPNHWIEYLIIIYPLLLRESLRN